MNSPPLPAPIFLSVFNEESFRHRLEVFTPGKNPEGLRSIFPHEVAGEPFLASF